MLPQLSKLTVKQTRPAGVYRTPDCLGATARSTKVILRQKRWLWMDMDGCSKLEENSWRCVQCCVSLPTTARVHVSMVQVGGVQVLLLCCCGHNVYCCVPCMNTSYTLVSSVRHQTTQCTGEGTPINTHTERATQNAQRLLQDQRGIVADSGVDYTTLLYAYLSPPYPLPPPPYPRPPPPNPPRSWNPPPPYPPPRPAMVTKA